jgi:hypothetical protein
MSPVVNLAATTSERKPTSEAHRFINCADDFNLVIPFAGSQFVQDRSPCALLGRSMRVLAAVPALGPPPPLRYCNFDQEIARRDGSRLDRRAHWIARAKAKMKGRIAVRGSKLQCDGQT